RSPHIRNENGKYPHRRHKGYEVLERIDVSAIKAAVVIGPFRSRCINFNFNLNFNFNFNFNFTRASPALKAIQ
ncbi:MAG: hypothetical protein P8L79_01540, partial [Rhodospirillaceae bacterium]|nr:hypothetical protein [Rhodospirillaceae bacterium]